MISKDGTECRQEASLFRLIAMSGNRDSLRGHYVLSSPWRHWAWELERRRRCGYGRRVPEDDRDDAAPAESRFLDGLALRVLRMSRRELTRETLCERINGDSDRRGDQRGGSDRTRIRPKRLGEYERGKKDIPAGDLHRVLSVLGYPLEAWVETRNHLERLVWIRSRHVGTRGEVVDGAPQGRQSWIHDADGSPDPDAVHREIRRIARPRSLTRERHDEELFGLLASLMLDGRPG